MHAAAEDLNPGYLRRMRGGLPWVRVKTGDEPGRPHRAGQWREPLDHRRTAARTDVQHFRARSSVILTGIGTVLGDDPALNVRIPESDRQPLRVVLDSNLRMPSDSRVVNREGQVLVIGTKDSAERRRSLERQNVEVVIQAGGGGRVDLRAVLDLLRERGANEVWVEAGPALAGAFVARGSVRRTHRLCRALACWGAVRCPCLRCRPIAALTQRLSLRFTDTRMVGDDLRLTARRVERLEDH